jgi:hypothetical protein
MSTDIAEIRRVQREAQEGFARDVDEVVEGMKDFAGALSPALGEISHGDALEALRRETIKAIDRCLMRRCG